MPMVAMCEAVFAKFADRSQPAWSPDGTQIAYRRREPSGSFIYIGTIDGKKEEKVAIGKSYPTWSPDGTGDCICQWCARTETYQYI